MSASQPTNNLFIILSVKDLSLSPLIRLKCSGIV